MAKKCMKCGGMSKYQTKGEVKPAAQDKTAVAKSGPKPKTTSKTTSSKPGFWDEFKKGAKAAFGYKKGGATKYAKGGASGGTALKNALIKAGYKKGGSSKAHPGFKAVQASIAKKSGVSKEAAGAILAASTRKASAKAKRANPRLKRVKG